MTVNEPIDLNPDHVALEQVISILTPLRRHRLARVERDRRSIELELDRLRERLLASVTSLSQERENQKLRRQQLSDTYLHVATGLTEVDRWLEQERHMLDRLAHIGQDVSQKRENVKQLEKRLLHVQQDVKALQRGVEKLTCMSESIHEN